MKAQIRGSVTVCFVPFVCRCGLNQSQPTSATAQQTKGKNHVKQRCFPYMVEMNCLVIDRCRVDFEEKSSLMNGILIRQYLSANSLLSSGLCCGALMSCNSQNSNTRVHRLCALLTRPLWVSIAGYDLCKDKLMATVNHLC